MSVAGKRPAAGGHAPVNHWQPRYLCAFAPKAGGFASPSLNGFAFTDSEAGTPCRGLS